MELIFYQLTFHHFKYDFKTMTLRSQKTFHRWKFIQLEYVIYRKIPKISPSMYKPLQI